MISLRHRKNVGSSTLVAPVGTRIARMPRTSIRTPSMSISTEASAKSLPARIGVTETTVIETRLDPASFDCTPSIGNIVDQGGQRSLPC